MNTPFVAIWRPFYLEKLQIRPIVFQLNGLIVPSETKSGQVRTNFKDASQGDLLNHKIFLLVVIVSDRSDVVRR